MDELLDDYDVVVIGGGPAGLNGALMLARSRRTVAVIDAGSPRNAPADAMHGFLGHDGLPPRELLERGRGEVRSYGGHVVTGDVARATRDDDETFVVALADGRRTRARRLLVTTGLVDELPEVPGVAELWGHDVLHCPYCHGWEVRDKTIGILATSPRAMHLAQLFRQLSDDIVYFAHTTEPSAEEIEQLAARDIRLVEGHVRGLDIVDGRLAGVRVDTGGPVACDALVVVPRMVARARFLQDLGLAPRQHPSGLGEHIPVDGTGRTDLAGVWAAGNVTDLAAQVGSSAAAGAFAAAQINADLAAEDTGRAVAAYRTRVAATS
jgi:thioredoxin reductase